jgi:hypothetical protein
MRVITLALGTAFLVLLVSGAGGGEAKKKPKLEGTWRAVSAIQNGKEDKTPEEHTLTFEGKTFAASSCCWRSTAAGAVPASRQRPLGLPCPRAGVTVEMRLLVRPLLSNEEDEACPDAGA